MKYSIMLLLINVCVYANSINNAIAGYILSDVKTNIDYRWQLKYSDKKAVNKRWQPSSRLNALITMPRMNDYLDILAVLEMGIIVNHDRTNTTESATNAYYKYGLSNRLNQAYVDMSIGNWGLSVGQRRLSFQQGKFVGDSSYKLFPQVFRQASIHSQDENLQLLVLDSVIMSNELTAAKFSKPSSIIVWKNIVSSPMVLDGYAYLFDGVSDTYSIDARMDIDAVQTLQSTFAIQSQLNRGAINQSSASTFYFDAEYSVATVPGMVTFGTRFFKQASDGTRFLMPYAENYYWDGYLNMFQSYGTTKNELLSDIQGSFQTFYLTLDSTNIQFDKLGVHAYLFRSSKELHNLGAEIDIVIKDALIKDHVFWTYKLMQYFQGDPRVTQKNQFAMSLDIALKLGEK